MSINKEQWIKKTLHWKNKWTQFLPEYDDDSNGINIYKFIEILNKNLKEDSVVCGDAGSIGYTLSQSLQLKENQRFILDSGQMGMGAWPLGIGVCLARDKKQTIICTGDGSFNFCPQALGTIKELKLPIILFIWNNNGYLSIRNTCDAFYNGRKFGTDSSNGLFFPSILRIAKAYEIHYTHIDKIIDLHDRIKACFDINEPIICEIKCDPDQKIIPGTAMKNGKSCALDDMYPFLSKEEYEQETIR